MDKNEMEELMPKRAAFIKWAQDLALDVTEDRDVWGRRKFAHSHIQAMWEGWFNAPSEIPAQAGTEDSQPAQPVAAKEEEILSLHRKMAGEKLRADQGWTRYEEANRDRNELRASLVVLGKSAPQQYAQAALSDEQIIEIATTTRSAEANKDGGYILPISFARAILSASRQLTAAPAEQAQGQAAAIPWGNTDARYIAQQRGTGRGENELTDDMVERAFRDGKPPSKMLREFSEASAALAQRAGSVKPKGSTSTNTEIKTWQDHKQDAAIIHPTGLVGTLLPDWYFRDAYEADLRTALEAARAAQPSQPAGAKKEALDDVKTLHRWSSQVERMASIFEDERSLLCHQAAVLLSRIAYTAPPAAVQSDSGPSAPTDISKRLREYAANPGYSHNDYADVMRTAADECERFYGGMMNWKENAQKKDRTIIELRSQQSDSERDAARYRMMKENDFTSEYSDYIKDCLNGREHVDLDAVVDAMAVAAPQTKEG